MKNRETIFTFILIALAVAVGFLTWFYYFAKERQESSVLSPTSEEEVSSDKSKAKEYVSKIKVLFTNEIYPTDEGKTNARLQTHIGKIQNVGDETITRVNVKIIYLDDTNRGIYDETVSINELLKPNYIKEFRFGGLNVPSEWTGTVSYEVVGLSFNDYNNVVSIPSRIDTSTIRRPTVTGTIFSIF